MASQEDLPVGPAYTECIFHNYAGHPLILCAVHDWHGHGDPPKAIPNNETCGFKHFGDSVGSVGGLAYVLELVGFKWIIAWSNVKGMPNKVYTEIFPPIGEIDWDDIKIRLDNSGCQSMDKKFGYCSEATIEPNGDTPKMMATIRQAA